VTRGIRVPVVPTFDCVASCSLSPVAGSALVDVPDVPMAPPSTWPITSTRCPTYCDRFDASDPSSAYDVPFACPEIPVVVDPVRGDVDSDGDGTAGFVVSPPEADGCAVSREAVAFDRMNSFDPALADDEAGARITHPVRVTSCVVDVRALEVERWADGLDCDVSPVTGDCVGDCGAV